jgi:hypothetical protein
VQVVVVAMGVVQEVGVVAAVLVVVVDAVDAVGKSWPVVK